MSFNTDQRSVVITGMGVISPNGCNLNTFWKNVRNGNPVADKISRFDAGIYPSQSAAEIQNFDPKPYLAAKQIRRMDLYLQYGIAAAKQALQDARLDLSLLDPDRCGIIEATSLGGLESTLKANRSILTKGYRGINPSTLTYAYCGGGSGETALELGVQGHAITYCSGSCSGNDAIGYAAQMIQSDDVDIMITGGSEAPILEGLWGVFCRCGVMSRKQSEPSKAMRPYDRDHDGFILGEGAAYLILEERAHALSRGARIYAEFLGHGRSCEAYHSVRPHPDGEGVSRAMEKALRAARLHAGEIDYVNTHGTATPSNDLVEARAIRRLFGAPVDRPAVSSTKPVTGHLLGAAGALETVICALTLHHRELPPSTNLDQIADGCELNFVRGEARPYPAEVVMNLNTGFGGKNACLILRRHSGEP